MAALICPRVEVVALGELLDFNLARNCARVAEDSEHLLLHFLLLRLCLDLVLTQSVVIEARASNCVLGLTGGHVLLPLGVVGKRVHRVVHTFNTLLPVRLERRLPLLAHTFLACLALLLTAR